jgi:hypothetical protein
LLAFIAIVMLSPTEAVKEFGLIEMLVSDGSAHEKQVNI